MTFQPYPRMLYKGADQAIVQDAEQEDAHRADGWGDYAADKAPSMPPEAPAPAPDPAQLVAAQAAPAPERKKPGRKPKAK